MSEKLAVTSAMRGRRNPSSRHSMYVLRQDGPELSFADAIKNHDALLTSIYGSRSVDQHLTTATNKADDSTLGNAGYPRSTVNFPPVTKSTTSNVWQPLFHHTTLVGSAAPLLATFKRDTHVQTEDEIRNHVGVQTEEAEIRPTTTYKRDVLVQTGEEWAALESGGGDVAIARNSEVTPNFAGDTYSLVLPLCICPQGYSSVNRIGEKNCEKKDNAAPSLQSPEVTKNYDPAVSDEKINIKSTDFLPKDENSQRGVLVPNPSQIFLESDRLQICSSDPEKDYVSLVPICKSEVSYFLPHNDEDGIPAAENFENVKFPQLESNNSLQECPSTKYFTSYEVITLKDPRTRVFQPKESESARPAGQEGPPCNSEVIISRTLSPDKQKTKENRHSLNMDDYKFDRLSSCNTSERGSMISMLDALYADSFKFESCENLDQLEEEIIRSLCTPVKELEENSKPTFEEDSMNGTECFPSLDHMGGMPNSSELFFNNMSDQQKTEWHPDAKLSTAYINCDFQSNGDIRSPDDTVRMKTPTRIDKRGMQARGEIMEKLMKGESVSSEILTNCDLNSAGSPYTNEVASQPTEENEISVELLPTQLAACPVILEVRRSSWSAVGPTTPPEKATIDFTTSRIQNNKTTDSPCENPVNQRENFDKCNGRVSSPTYIQDQVNASNSSPKVRDVEIISAGKPLEASRPPYWPLQRNYDSDQKVKNEVHINLSPSKEPSLSPQRESYVSAVANTDTIEKVKPCSPSPPPVVPPPPPPPPPPQNYQPSPKTSGISVNTVAKGNESSSCPLFSKNSSPGNLGFLPSSQKDLMMQELTLRFQKRQKDSMNSQVVRHQHEGINHVENHPPNCDNKDNANPASPHHAHKEPSPGSNAANKSVWSSTNGEDYIDHNGKDAAHSPSDYKNGIQYNNSHSPQDLPGQEVKHHPVGSYSSNSPCIGQYNEAPSYPNKGDTKHPSSFPGNIILTDEPPPAGAVLVDQKVTVEGDQVHTDKFYAVPLKEILKEKTSTAKFTPAPPKYEGIGPTEDGVPTGLRQSVRKENMSNWYKTMFKSLHKAGHPHYGGYNSDPEFEREEMAIITKCATLDNRQKPSDVSRKPIGKIQHGYPPSAKSTVEVYNVHPRPIEDYEPGYSSAVDNENTMGSKRFLPSLNHPKPSYEFKSGYESDTSIIKKLYQPDSPHPEQQKLWYREIQRGGDIPQYGLGKSAPEKPKEPVIGPAPSPSYQGSPIKPTYPQAVRPHTPPPEYVTNDSSTTDVINGNYSAQMQHAIHTELQRRMSPLSQQTSVGHKTSPKSPSKSPELKMFAKVLYDFISESPRELNLKKEDMVLICRQLDKNWYEGERKGAIGIFPVSYVEILPPEHVSPEQKQPLEGLAKAVYDFRAQTSVELSLKKGDTVSLIRRVDQNWYEGRVQERKGIFPATYVQIVQEPGEFGRNSVSPTTKTADNPYSFKVQEDSIKKSPSICPTPPPSHSSTHAGMSVSSSPNACGRAKKGSSLVEPVLYRALYGYSPQNADELELLDGDNVYVVEMCDDGWFVGTSVRTGVFGIFPGNYVEKV